MHCSLAPAYGRDYKSKKAVVEAFNANNDFILHDISSPWDGKPCNKSSLQQEGRYRQANLRYKGLRMVTVVSVPSLVAKSELAE